MPYLLSFAENSHQIHYLRRPQRLVLLVELEGHSQGYDRQTVQSIPHLDDGAQVTFGVNRKLVGRKCPGVDG